MGQKYEIRTNAQGQLILLEHGIVTIIGDHEVNEWVNHRLNQLAGIKYMVKTLAFD